MGGESNEAWRAVLDDLIKRGLRRPEFLIVDGAPGLDKAIAAAWDGARTGRSRPAIPIDCDQAFRLIAATDSGRSRPACGRR
jgi:transposase-like protein